MWADGEPIDPSPTVDQALNGGFPWLEIECSRCRIKRDVSLAELPHVDTTCIHDLATRLRCERCAKAESARWRHCCSWRLGDGTPGGAMMPELTRHRTNDRHETWTIRVRRRGRRHHRSARLGSEPGEIWRLAMVLRLLPAPSRRMFQRRRTGLRSSPRRLRCRLEGVPAEAHRGGVRGLAAGRNSGLPTNTRYGMPDIATSSARPDPVRMWRDVQSRHPRTNHGPYRTHHRKSPGNVMDRNAACAISIR